MTYQKLPADPTAMILGIIALVISFAGCCCGIFAVIPLVLSIIGLIMANKSLREFQENQEAFAPQSRSNVATAKIINLIALILSSLIAVLYIAYFIFYGAFLSTAIMEGYKNQDTYDDGYYEWEKDSIDDFKDDSYEIEVDTFSVDTLEIDDLLGTEIETDSLNN